MAFQLACEAKIGYGGVHLLVGKSHEPLPWYPLAVVVVEFYHQELLEMVRTGHSLYALVHCTPVRAILVEGGVEI